MQSPGLRRPIHQQNQSKFDFNNKTKVYFCHAQSHYKWISSHLRVIFKRALYDRDNYKSRHRIQSFMITGLQQSGPKYDFTETKLRYLHAQNLTRYLVIIHGLFYKETMYDRDNYTSRHRMQSLGLKIKSHKPRSKYGVNTDQVARRIFCPDKVFFALHKYLFSYN